MVHFPGLTLSGACDIINIEAIPGGPLGVWSGVTSPQDHLAKTLELIRTWFPWEAHRFANVRLTDDLATQSGPVTPTVRKPIAILPSGQPVMGIGDVFLLNDPITGQGSNNRPNAPPFTWPKPPRPHKRPPDRFGPVRMIGWGRTGRFRQTTGLPNRLISNTYFKPASRPT